VSWPALVGGIPWRSAQPSHGCSMGNILAGTYCGGLAAPCCCGVKGVRLYCSAARTVGGCTKTAGVGAAVPWVACKPCGTLVEHC
jgi:hypothetical protein